MKRRAALVAFASVMALAFVACSSSAEEATPIPTPPTLQPATIEDVELRPVGTFSTVVEIWVSGLLPDGCTRIGDVTVGKSGTDIILDLPTITAKTEGCEDITDARFIEIVQLDFGTFGPGDYTIRAGAASESFDIGGTP